MADITTSSNPSIESREADKSGGSLMIVDIGKKQTRKRIRGLRKGKGRLFDKVSQLVEEMREKGAIDENTKPLVIVVRQKPRSTLGLKL